LKVGHSARNIKESVRIASKDITVITNMMETRLIEGDSKNFEILQSQLRDKKIWPAKKYFQAKVDEQSARHLHYGDTAYNLEPNIKESPGGLRDLHMISWVANRYFGTSNFAELVEHKFLTPHEYKTLIRGRDFLWKLRNGLHLLANRCEDRLLFDYQRELAQQLGYTQKQNHLAVEQMMQQYYRTAKEIQLLNEISLQHFEEAILTTQKLKRTKINDRFYSVGNYLEIADKETFKKNPSAILELFLLMQRHPNLVGVRASTIRQLLASLNIIDGSYRKSNENLNVFLGMFKQQDGLTHTLRRMNNYGVLGKFFPEFGRIVGQMQHDLFHIFTVDAHSLFVVSNLRKLMLERYRDEFPVLRAIIAKLNQRERLFLAALCHDIGKGSGRDHSEVGEEIGLSFCKRLGMSEYDSKFVSWLVRNHLIMSWTAQREDTSDPRVIDRFAETVGDQEHLDNLYLLTVADMRGTSHKVWSEWKGQLLSNLYTATSRRLRSGISGVEAISQRIEDRKKAVKKLVGHTIPDSQLEEMWSQLDEEYFLRNGPETCAWHAQQICQAKLLDLPLVAIRYRPEINAEQILIVSPEFEELLSRSTGALDSLGLGILDARIHQTRSGLGILVFIVGVDQKSNASERARSVQKDKIQQFLMSPPEQYRPASRSIPRALKQFKVPTSITFTDNEDIGHTTMEIVSQDQPGLLYHVSLALLECKIRLVSAKVSTVGEKAEDTFFISDRDGLPVSQKKQRVNLKNRITQYLR
jgi:[protein-PII] uridylyltransferase